MELKRDFSGEEFCKTLYINTAKEGVPESLRSLFGKYDRKTGVFSEGRPTLISEEEIRGFLLLSC